MPGSRVKEVRMNLPTILDAAKRAGLELRIPAAGGAAPWNADFVQNR